MTKLVPFGRLPDIERLAKLDAALEEFSQGRDLDVIAASLKVTPTTLCRHLIRDREDGWRAARKTRALAELDEAERDLREAADMFQVKKAETRSRLAQWQLERLYRSTYGNKEEGPRNDVRIILNLGGSGETIEGEVVKPLLSTDAKPA